jgi:hypothetical protein
MGYFDTPQYNRHRSQKIKKIKTHRRARGLTQIFIKGRTIDHHFSTFKF